jgi:hypothetical protein
MKDWQLVKYLIVFILATALAVADVVFGEPSFRTILFGAAALGGLYRVIRIVRRVPPDDQPVSLK